MGGSITDGIAMINNRPAIVAQGQVVSEVIYCDYILNGEWEARIAEFARQGVRVYLIQPQPPWHGGELNALWNLPAQADAGKDLTLSKQAEIILKHKPDALFFIRCGATPPQAWLDAHPEHTQTDEDGRRYPDASLASALYFAEMQAFFARLVRYGESQPWRDRIIGYLEASLGEGVTMLTIGGKMFDVSPAAEEAFRAWLRKRYQTDTRLQEAWGRHDATLAGRVIPRDSAWLARRKQGPATISGKPVQRLSSNSGEQPSGFFHWLEAANARQEHDYCRFMREMFLRKYRGIAAAIKDTARALGCSRVVGFDVTKQPLLGWQIQLAFDGIGDGQSFPNILLLSGSYDTTELLDDPNIDLVFTPADYHARSVGFAYEAEGLSDSLVLRGKPMLIENDARTWVGSGRHEQGAFRTPQEAEAGLLRNAGLTMSRGLQSYWCNVGSSYFHDPEIQKIVAKIAPMLERHARTQHRETEDAIAFVIDDESMFAEDFTSGYLSQAVIWQRIIGLAHCGVPYRIFLWSDLRQPNMPDYKVWFFPNLFVLNDERMAVLRAKVLRNGNVAIFGPATGISDGEHLTADLASRLLNVRMELVPRTAPRRVIVQDSGHPLTRPLPASLVFGDSLPYGPILVPTETSIADSGAVALGHATTCWFINRAGLFLKEEGRGSRGNGKPGAAGPHDYAMLWTCAMPLPPCLLREACRYAGCHIWCEEDDVIYANADLVCLHSVKAGPRIIRLPRPSRIVDAITGRELANGQSEIKVVVDPPQTFIFRLE